MINIISSKENPKIKLAASLKQRSNRREHNLFFFEGIKLVLEAIDCNIKIVNAFFDENSLMDFSSEADRLIEKGCEVFSVPSQIFKKISDSETPQGVLCVAEKFEIKNADTISNGRYMALENLSDPGNAGAVLRCAEAFSLDGVIISSHSVDLFSPKTIRGSMGSAFRVPCFYSENLPEDIKALNEKGFDSFCADLDKDARSLSDTVFSNNCVTVIGNESSGISKEMKNVCKKSLYIPMKGKNESLNASVAAGIIAWEMAK